MTRREREALTHDVPTLEYMRDSFGLLAAAMQELGPAFVDEYQKAGCPFGTPGPAMAIWWKFGQRTTTN